MRLPDKALNQEDRTNQEKRHPSNSSEAYEQLYVDDDGLISLSRMDTIIELDKIKLLLERREREIRQAAEYGLGLLENNEELRMEVATLTIRLETETEELTVQRDMWQRRTEHYKQETAQWKRKFARVEGEMADLSEKFEQFADRCQCRELNTGSALDTIAQLQTELQELYAVGRSNEAELSQLRQWKELAEQKQQEALECEALASRSEVLYRKSMEAKHAVAQRVLNDVKNENNRLCRRVQKYEEEIKVLKKQLRRAEKTRDDALGHNNELSETLLSSESRCKRLQRELELLEHVSYFAQASVDRDNEESDPDDEIVEKKQSQSAKHANTPLVTGINTETTGNNTDDVAILSPLRMKRRESYIKSTVSPYLLIPTILEVEDGTQVKVSESEMESQKKLYHYFYLTALSIIHENNLHERCFSSSSRVTIDMWYCEVIAKDVPFLLWHSWLINRISDVAAYVQVDEKAPHQPPSSSLKSLKLIGLYGFSLRKSNNDELKYSFPSPATSSPAASPVARVPFTVARAFFSLLRKSSRAGAGSSPVSKFPVGGSPAG